MFQAALLRRYLNQVERTLHSLSQQDRLPEAEGLINQLEGLLVVDREGASPAPVVHRCPRCASRERELAIVKEVYAEQSRQPPQPLRALRIFDPATVYAIKNQIEAEGGDRS